MALFRILISINSKQNLTNCLTKCRLNLCRINNKTLFTYNSKLSSIESVINTNNITLNSIKSLNLNQKCSLHLSPKRFNPLVSIVLRNVMKLAAVFTGRALRKWWSRMPPNKRQLFINWLNRHKWKILFILTSITSGFYLYYLTHICETPITKRKRFIAFTTKQLKDINDYEFQVKYELFKSKLLPNNHPTAKRVARIATQLLKGNNDLIQIYEHEWSVSVVDDPNIKNAFVLPSGQIFVFTGMVSLCENDQQLGVVLAHEMAHAVLGHGSELVSHAHLIDFVFIAIMALIWTLMPSDLTAAITTAISKFVMTLILDMPYSRMLETEADIVGLELAAKACLDVRETSAFWHRMFIIEKAEQGFGLEPSDVPLKIEFALTHPSHETRYLYLDSLMDDAIKLRDKCNCHRLGKQDPRDRVELMKKSIQDNFRAMRKEGIFLLPKPIPPSNLKID